MIWRWTIWKKIKNLARRSKFRSRQLLLSTKITLHSFFSSPWVLVLLSIFFVVKYCTFWPLSVIEKRNSTVAAFSNWVDAATNFYRQPPLYSLVATCKAGSSFFCLQVVRRKLLQKVMVDYCIHSKKDLVSSNKGSRPSKSIARIANAVQCHSLLSGNKDCHHSDQIS